jgi:hypothetical protein
MTVAQQLETSPSKTHPFFSIRLSPSSNQASRKLHVNFRIFYNDFMQVMSSLPVPRKAILLLANQLTYVPRELEISRILPPFMSVPELTINKRGTKKSP